MVPGEKCASVTCAHCPRPALRKVGRLGFCGKHFVSANQEQARVIVDLDRAEVETERELRRKLARSVFRHERESERYGR